MIIATSIKSPTGKGRLGALSFLDVRVVKIKKSYYKGHENGLFICKNYIKAKNIKKKEEIQIQFI